MTQPVPAAVRPPAGGFGVGLAAAVAGALVGAIAWAVITVTSNYRIGVVAVGIGFLVGLAIERFGGGDRRLPVAGAVIALLGCLLGDLFAEAHIIGRDLHIGIADVLQHPHALWNVYTHTFRAFDAVFYAIAAYEGFRFGQRGVRRAQVAAAANQPPSIDVPENPAPGPVDTPVADRPADPPIG